VAERVVVVGAGLAGLTAATVLAQRGEQVTLVERLPSVGGVWGFDGPAIVSAEADCRRTGVVFHLGCSALRWTGERLLIVGPGDVQWLEADRLVFAGGSRPPTAAELGIAGGRLAGVFAATVAHHLLDAGVVLGRKPVIVGSPADAAIVLSHLAEHGHVTIVGGERSDRSGSIHDTVDWWPGYRPLRLHGTDRVDLLDVSDGVAHSRLYCDAVILAGPALPLRNIDGAVRDDSVGVTFVQPLEPALGATRLRDAVRRDLTSPRLQGTLVP